MPRFFRRHTTAVTFFDVGANIEDIRTFARKLPSPRVVVIPALFGDKPWLDVAKIKAGLDPSDIIILDAAQTAFGHSLYPGSERTFVLSCPRKTTSLNDGAVLAVPANFAERRQIARLPEATEAAALKRAARAIWATDEPGLEAVALTCNIRSERSWPDGPHRMTDESLALLLRLDQAWHRELRQRNYRALMKALRGRIPFWDIGGGTPFCMPIFVRNRKTTLSHLHRRRIFASPLWLDAKFSSAANPAAAWIARHLISLPVDQRHGLDDIRKVARAVLEVAQPPSQALPTAITNRVG